jgi:ACT domain-containing protein
MHSNKASSGLLITGVLLGQILLVSCSAGVSNNAPQSTTASDVSAPNADAQLAQEAGAAQKNLVQSSRSQEAVVAQPKAQLIKTASLSLRVQDVEAMIQKATAVVTKRGGDMLGLQDQVPEDVDTRRTATFKFRVPQAALDATLAELAKLGTVETRSIEVEDVSTQIVDSQARLRNLRKSETMVLSIMERSGSVSDVLKVSQELGKIRSQIEQLQAQVQNLKGQVAYSSINLTLTAAIAQNQQGAPVGDRLKETWSQSTHAVGETTTNLLRLALWLLVFSPYLLGGAGLIWLMRKGLARSKQPPTVTQSSDGGTTN